MGLHIGKTLKKVAKKALPVAAAAAGAYFGGPAGMAAGSQVGGALSGSDSGSTGSGFDWSGLVQGAVGIGSDLLDAGANAYFNKQAADYSYKKNLQMWNLQNAYNDPSAQMARLQAAGLNPNLVYGGGNVTGNAASSAPEYKLDGNVYQSKAIQRQQLQLALAEHQQRITNQSIENDLARQRLDLAAREADRSDALAQAQIAAMKSSMGYQGANIENMAFNQRHNVRKFAFDRYKADLQDWQNIYNEHYNKYYARAQGEAAARRKAIEYAGRRPMLMDYMPGGLKYNNY